MIYATHPIVTSAINDTYLLLKKPKISTLMDVIRERCQQENILPPFISTVRERIKRLKSQDNTSESDELIQESQINHHDRYMRTVLSDSMVAKDYFQNTLPPEVLQIVDMETIQPEPESFIDDKLSLRITDLLYKVDFTIAGKKEPGFLFLLIEHTSSSQPMLPLRMMEYMIRVLVKYVDQHPRAQKLPPIYPHLIYNGKVAYRHSLNFFDLFGTYKNFMQTLWNHELSLLDLSQVSDTELRKFEIFEVCALIAKHIHDSDLLPLIEHAVIDAFNNLAQLGSHAMIRVTMNYIYRAGSVKDVDALQELLLNKLGEKAKEEVMGTIADQLIEKGQKIGWADGEKFGLERGLEQGLLQKEKEDAQKMYMNGITVEIIAKILEITEEKVQSYLTEITKH